MTRISYKMTKRKTKNEKFEKFLQIFNITNFKTIPYELTALDNIIYFIGNYKFLRPVSILGLTKE